VFTVQVEEPEAVLVELREQVEQMPVMAQTTTPQQVLVQPILVVAVVVAVLRLSTVVMAERAVPA
jgi:hypothetical protein